MHHNGNGEPASTERREGPTPAGGAYAVAYLNARGEIVEIVEFDASDRPIARTYSDKFADNPGARRIDGEDER